MKLYMNNSYTKFASYYDKLIKPDIDYKKIAGFINEQVLLCGKKDNIILDLACGTGNLTDILKSFGYDMIGVDLSCEMLDVAKQKNPDILYLCQDMREFELYGTVDAICCMTDSLNYITDVNDLLHVFCLAKNYLNPNMPFIFDLNSYYKLSRVIANNTFTYDDGDIFYVWENEYCKKTDICDFYLTFFVREGKTYRRFDEQHSEKAYKKEEIESLLRQAGFSDIQCFADYEKSMPADKSERLIFVAK